METLTVLFAVVIGSVVAQLVARRKTNKALVEPLEGDNVTFPASLRGDEPLPTSWNFNSGHLTVSAIETTWRPHLRRDTTVMLPSGNLSVESIRKVKGFERWMVSGSALVVKLRHHEGSVEIAALPNGVRALLRALNAEDHMPR